MSTVQNVLFDSLAKLVNPQAKQIFTGPKKELYFHVTYSLLHLFWYIQLR